MARLLELGESTSPAFTGAMAKEMRVGGTSLSRKEPDMESFAADSSPAEVQLSLQSAQQGAKGLPQRRGSSRSFSKNS